MDELAKMMEGLTVGKKRKDIKSPPKQARKSRKPTLASASMNMMNMMDIDVVMPKPTRVMARASRASRNNEAVASELMLPLERTPSFASDTGKTLIRHIKTAIKIHRDIRVILPSFFDAIDAAQKLLADGRTLEADTILREQTPTFKKLEKMHEGIRYAVTHTEEYREKIERVQNETSNVDDTWSIRKLRSFFIKHQREMEQILQDDIRYFDITNHVFQTRESRKKDEKMEKQLLQALSTIRLISPTQTPESDKKQRAKKVRKE